MPTQALIGLGSNLGDRRAVLEAAVAALGRAPGVTLGAVSGFRETAPVGGPPGQRPFLNGAVSVETTLEPDALLQRLHAIETDAGRIRAVRWGERTLDLDLLLYGQRIVDEPGLVIPHPRMWVRRFVLEPLREVAPGVHDPVTGRTMSELLGNLDRRPAVVALAGWSERPGYWPLFQRLGERLNATLVRAARPEQPLEWSATDGIQGIASVWLELVRQGGAPGPDVEWIVVDAIPEITGTPEPPRASPISGSSPGGFPSSLLASRLVPTFVVRVGDEPQGRAFARILGIPTLRITTDDPEAILAEVLAACAATHRVGSAPND